MFSILRKIVPKVCIIDGKAAAFYFQVRRITRLITGVQHVVNNDLDVGDLPKVFFLLNYNLSLSEVIIRANDLSEHTSTVRTEASFTLNMKFLMKDGLIV